MVHEGITEEELFELVRRTEAANLAWVNGDIGGYLGLYSHAEDMTLMGPFGGEPTRGFAVWHERAARAAGGFRNGSSAVELVQSYASGGMVVLVMIERQRGEVGGLPAQDWSLRVTQVYRREGDGWRVAHRHAEPLTRGRGLEETAALACGPHAA